MAENYPFPIYFILLIITITRLISTVGKTEQWKSSSSSLPIELYTNKFISEKLT
jgi:cytokinin dehydrogenase